MSTYRLLAVNADAKTRKGVVQGYLTGILYLAPHKSSGRNLCAFASPGCIASCINTAGLGSMSSVQAGRLRKSEYLRKDRASFLADLGRDLGALTRHAQRVGLAPLVRLNGTSDLPWLRTIEEFTGLRFYDYTKNRPRMLDYLRGKLPANYSLTFSRSEMNDDECMSILAMGGNVAVVFDTPKGQSLPATWNGYPVTDGDISDARPSDAKGVVIGLRAKGKAKLDTTGFVIRGERQ